MFENFISLGSACHVAASMSKIGIRAFSGPFDWYTSPFNKVIECLENDFKDFLKKDNIQLDENPKQFRDTKYDFFFNHEIKKSLDEDFDDFYNKYMRRIENFRNYIKEKTCFIRSISFEEIDCIKQISPQIETILKKSNSENEIIYLVTNPPEDEKNFKYPFFDVKYHWIPWFGRKSLRSLFDSNLELQNFLISNYNEAKRDKNLIFDLQSEQKKLEIPNYRYVLLTQIEKIDLDKIKIPYNLVIYGAGKIGKTLYRKIKDICKILCFVDRNPKEKEYENISILSFDEFIKSKMKNELVVITPSYQFEEIKNNLLKNNVNNIISVEDLFN